MYGPKLQPRPYLIYDIERSKLLVLQKRQLWEILLQLGISFQNQQNMVSEQPGLAEVTTHSCETCAPVKLLECNLRLHEN